MAGADIDIRDIWSLLRRRLRLIVMTFLMVTGMAGVAAIALPKFFTASALILIDPSRKNLLDPDMQAASAASDHARVDSEAEILRSDMIFLDAIASLGLESDPEFGVRPGWQDRVRAFLHMGEAEPPRDDAARQEVLRKLKDATAVQRRGLNYLISVQVRSRDPARAALLANALAEAYIAGQLRAKIDNVLAAGRVLAVRAGQARTNMAETERRLDVFVSGYIEQRAGEDAQTRPAGTAMSNEDMGRLRQQMRSGLVADDLPLDVLTELFALQQAADLARAHYQTLLARNSDLEAEAELQLSDSRIVSPAISPVEPSFPNGRVLLLFAGLGGLALGVGVAFVYDNFLGGLTSSAQLAAVTRRPALGEVPFHKLPLDMASASQLMIDAPLSRYAEAIRQIRAGMDQHLFALEAGGAEGRVVMVTSSLTGEGKTALALSLARAYAASGRKTLIIDCDLRRPSIHVHLDFEPDKGLLDYLTGDGQAGSLTTMVVREGDTGLNLLVGSRRSGMPTDQLVSGAAFARLVAAAADHFDIVVLDTPPIREVVDGLYLAGHADAVLFVVKWSATAQIDVRSALEQLALMSRPGTPILTALNQQLPRLWPET